MIKSIFPKIFPIVMLAISFFAGLYSSRAESGGIFLTLHAKDKTKNSDVTLKGRAGIGAQVSIFVNGENFGAVSLDERNKYHVRVPLAVGRNSIRVVASLQDEQKVIEKKIERKAGTAYEKPLWISIVRTKNRIKKPDVTVKGKAYGVFGVSVSVDGVFQGTASVSSGTGKFKFRASLAPGVNVIEVRAENSSENVTATKRIRRL